MHYCPRKWILFLLMIVDVLMAKVEFLFMLQNHVLFDTWFCHVPTTRYRLRVVAVFSCRCHSHMPQLVDRTVRQLVGHCHGRCWTTTRLEAFTGSRLLPCHTTHIVPSAIRNFARMPAASGKAAYVVGDNVASGRTCCCRASEISSVRREMRCC